MAVSRKQRTSKKAIKRSTKKKTVRRKKSVRKKKTVRR